MSRSSFSTRTATVTVSAISSISARTQRPEPRSPLLSEAVDHYEREQWAAGRWKAEKAGHAAMAELRRFLQHVGDRPVGEVSREDVRAFRDHRGESLLASTLNIKVMSRLVSFPNRSRWSEHSIEIYLDFTESDSWKGA